MKKLILLTSVIFAFLIISNTSASGQQTPKKRQTVDAKAKDSPKDSVTKLTRPINDKNKPVLQSRGDIYGPNYSDVTIANHTGLNVDIYVDNVYRGTIGPFDVKTTWAIPGNNSLYAKAIFDDGTYKYWGPLDAFTNYQYTWNLYN